MGSWGEEWGREDATKGCVPPQPPPPSPRGGRDGGMGGSKRKGVAKKIS